jgi:hypothetical protein
MYDIYQSFDHETDYPDLDKDGAVLRLSRAISCRTISDCADPAPFDRLHELMRESYPAVMAAGHCGVGLGQTPNAVANMAAVIDKNGPAPTAWFVLPVVTVIFINIMNPIIITAFINFLA